MGMSWDLDLRDDELIASLEGRETKALTEAMEVIRAVAVEGTPVEKGDLAGSASISVDGNEATLEYPGPYARRQHEELDWHHETGRAKYLELACIEEGDNALRVLTEELGESLE